ncbi:hypothetical protein N7447_010372 [Penicillium robsamsonii]|uniref:uncharacterized protein n=1 Tax=Penicillium robsamsonii TaxID=1792511 RepID=UPI0025487BA8|nr:uncharacterized protein N7447_010372 [Penicillium robsamsonii]KAJ5810856.1 hypothetical protein N7447_010372 [Penicillium robsamsonii]
MSIEIPERQTAPSVATSATPSENIPKAKEIIPSTETSTVEKEKDTFQSSIYSPANLLSSLLSPFSFSGTSPDNKEKEKETKSSTKISIETPTLDSTTQPTPEPYYTPEDTPLYKALYKTRLTKTRTKQLLRAGERAYNDPPPPPGLGDCCGSSCDPCVRDLWKQEIGIWRERWGDWGIEEGAGVLKSEKKEEKLGNKKELEW